MEGTLYLVASVLLLDQRAVLRSLRTHPLATLLSATMMGMLIGGHWFYGLPRYPNGSIVLNPKALPMDVLDWESFHEALLGQVRYDPTYTALIAAGVVAGLADRRLRIGLGAGLGSLILILPVTQSGDAGILTLHRWVPVYGLQTVAAGVGAFSARGVNWLMMPAN